MKKILLPLFSLALVGTTYLSSVYLPIAVAQSSNNAPASKVEEKKSTSILEAILSLLKSPENRLITRGSELCPMSPGNIGEQLVWNDRPLFIWSGANSESELNLFSSSANSNYEEDEELIWTQTVAPNTATVAYAGNNLQPGFIYDWHLVDANKEYRLTFQLMPKEAREEISADLTAIETELQTTGATAEEIAIAKADYFANKQLWSDALQELYAVDNPSPLLLDKTQAIGNYLCQSDTEA